MSPDQSVNALFAAWLSSESARRSWLKAAADLAERNAVLERMITEQLEQNDQLQRELDHKDRAITFLAAESASLTNRNRALCASVIRLFEQAERAEAQLAQTRAA